MTVRRGTTNRNARGSSSDRLARRTWLLFTYAADVYVTILDTDGIPLSVRNACRCYRCGKLLTIDTVTVDRIVPGCHGGTYRRNNVRPACAKCNSETGAPLRSKR